MAKEVTEEEERLDEYHDIGGGVPAGAGLDDDTTPLHPSEEKVPNLNPESERGPSTDTDINRDYDIILDDAEKKQWSDKPCYADQYLRYPETVRKIGPTLEVFDLADENDKHKLNTLMAGQQSHSAPRSAVAVEDRKWDEKTSNWKILAQVITFKYLKILEKD